MTQNTFSPLHDVITESDSSVSNTNTFPVFHDKCGQQTPELLV